MKTPTLLDVLQALAAPRPGEIPPSPHEKLMGVLCEMLYATDEVKGVLEREYARDYRWIEPRIQRIYDTVNGIMKKLEG